MTKKMMLSTVAIGAMFSMLGCGGGSNTSVNSNNSNNNNNGQTTTGKAYYIDAAVSGVKYKCGTQEGLTATDGGFTFDVGSGCALSLGDIPLKTIDKTLLVDNVKILEDDVKTAALLQSLDLDGDASNGITITPEVVEAMATALNSNGGDGTLPKTAGELTALIAALQAAVPTYQGQAVSKTEAQTHLDETKLHTFLDNKTFYAVQVISINNKLEASLKSKITFNADLTQSVTIEGEGSTDEEKSTDTISISGNKLYVTEEKDEYFKLTQTTNDYLEVDFYIINNGTEEHDENVRFYFDKAKADAYIATLPSDQSASHIPLTLAMLQGKTFYTINDRGDGTYDFEEITFLSDTTLSFREVFAETNGTIIHDSKGNLPYSLDNQGKLLVDFSTPGDPSTFTYILLSQDNTTWYMSKNGYTDSPYSYWLLSKPTNFPN